MYNEEKYIAECLNSIKRQSFADYEVIVVNDGSTDNSEEACKEVIKGDSRFMIVSTKNFGQSHARNEGLKLSSGEYVYFLDADDYLYDDNLGNIMKDVSRYAPDVSVFSYYFLAGQNSHLEKIDKKRIMQTLAEFQEIYKEKKGAWTPGRNIFKRSFLLENGIYYDESLSACEDFDFNMKACFSAKTFFQSNDILFCYRHGREGSLSTKKGKKFYMDTFITFCKWHGRLNRYKEIQNTISNIYYGEMCNVFCENLLDREMKDVLGKTKKVLRTVSGKKRKVLACLCQISVSAAKHAYVRRKKLKKGIV